MKIRWGFCCVLFSLLGCASLPPEAAVCDTWVHTIPVSKQYKVQDDPIWSIKIVSIDVTAKECVTEVRGEERRGVNRAVVRVGEELPKIPGFKKPGGRLYDVTDEGVKILITYLMPDGSYYGE